jgi:hypothetical protein
MSDVNLRRSFIALSTTALVVAAVAAPVMAQSPAASAVAPSLPAGPAITVVATEYHFGGLPTTVPVGTTLSLSNQGKELHELQVFRRNDGVTQSFEELLQLPQDQALQLVTPVGGLFATPGGSAEGTIPLSQEGDYIALCFVPQGMTELPADPNASLDPALASATPHFMLGMVQTFTVTAAGTEAGPLPSAAPMGSDMPMGSTAP